MNVLVIDIGGCQDSHDRTEGTPRIGWTDLIAKLFRPRRKPVETPKKNP
jgi:hypothetical protein